jgi:Bacterial Ig-like domain (group 2)/Abnormal spindle-like microcephaly-assoc'd, ASPM-SPD-2-Hydin
VTPLNISFGNYPIGQKSGPKKVTVTNNQTVNLTISSITPSLPDYSTTTTCPLTPATLGTGSTCTVSVFFTPTVEGTRNDTLTIIDDASNSPTVGLTGVGYVPAVASPPSLTFASEPLGVATPAQVATLTANQSLSLTISKISSSLPDYGLTSTCPLIPKHLPAGASCTVSVTFTPKVIGARTGTLSFKESGITSPQTVSLSGTGLAAALVSIAVSPQSPSINLGTKQQFTAVGTYTNGSTRNLTSSVTWSSSLPAVASVNKGLATGLGKGATTITATSGTISGASTLTVIPVLVSLSITPSSSSIPLGTTQQFSATGTYNDGSTQDLTTSVNWASSAPAVATIDAGGLATSVGTGTSTVFAISGSIAASANLTVIPAALASIAITPTNPSFALGTKQQLKATGTYTDGSTLDLTDTVTWNTAKSAIATVSNQGLATAVSVGSTSVSASLGSITGSTTLNVSPAALVSIAVTPVIPSIPLGNTQQFTATGTFTDGSTQDLTTTVQWSSDTLTVATISNTVGSQGLATSVGTGSATITATSGSVSGSTTFTVTAATLVLIAVTPANPSIALGTTQQFTATGTFTDGSTQDLTPTVSWASDTLSTASISKTGLATSVGIGTANISATSGSVTGSTVLTVTAAVLVSIAINPQTPTVPLGLTQQFTATGTYSDGTTQDLTQSGHWSSTNAAVATISNSVGTQGLATTLAIGTTTIGISSGSVNGSATLTVNPAALVSIAISPLAPTIALGTTQQFTGTGTYTDSSTQDVTSVVTWSSSSATVAIISNSLPNNGLATSAGVGTTNITASLGSISASTTLTVGSAQLVSIAVSPATVSIPLDTTQQFLATGTYTDGSTQNLTGSASWTSSMTAVATISNSVPTIGLASGTATGTTTITATSGSISGSATLTVTAAALVTISVAPLNPSIPLGTTQQFTATGTYTDSSTQNITNSVTWTSSSATVATISNSSGTQGLATSTGEGSTTITASLGSVTGSTTLTVGSPQLVSIAITPANEVTEGSSQQFTATGTFTDNSTQDLTTSVTWSSSNAAVASINGTGLATFVSIGTTIIEATLGSISNSTNLTVTAVTSGMEQLASDNFNRQNASTLGPNWTVMGDSYNNGIGLHEQSPQIISDQIQGAGPSVVSKAMYYGGINWPADQYSEGQIIAAATSNTGDNGPAVRMTTDDSHYLCDVNSIGAGSATVHILLVTNGSGTSLAGSTTATVSAGDVVRCTVQGSTITMTDQTTSTILLTATDTTLPSGYPGWVIASFGSNLSDYIAANWAGGAGGTAPSLQTLASDNFNRADAPNLGPNWHVGTGHDPVQIVSNQIEPDASPVDPPSKEHYIAYGPFPNDQWSEDQIVSEDVIGDNGVEIRASDSADTLYLCDVNLTGAAGTAEVRLVRVLSGTAVAMNIAATYVSVLPSDYIRGQVQGSLISMVDVTQGTLLLTVNDTSITSGYPGVTLQTVSGSPSDHIAANWSGGGFNP